MLFFLFSAVGIKILVLSLWYSNFADASSIGLVKEEKEHKSAGQNHAQTTPIPNTHLINDGKAICFISSPFLIRNYFLI